MDDQAGPDEAHVLQLQLELNLNREPITGRLRTRWGAEQRFVGWLGFIDALKRLQQQDEGSTDPASAPPDS